MKRVLAVVGAVLVATAAGGMLFAWSGVYNVAASRGHWAVTRALLQFGMRESVQTHAPDAAVPDLADPALVIRGAGHFQGGCAPCHGAPGEAPSEVTRHMLPHPPELSAHVGSWTDEELFWIVKHGFKYTGMPAWPTQQRDDEVWAAVAFLRRLPELSAAEYRMLAIGEAEDGARDGRLLALTGPIGESAAACARCHGLDGAGRGRGAYPRITGQHESYLYSALRDYAAGSRASGIMQVVAAELGDEEMRALASHYGRAEAPFPEPLEVEDIALLQRGGALAAVGAPERDVPACAACHGKEGRSSNPLFPSLAGQHAGYLQQQLELWRAGLRGDTPASNIMAAVARRLDDEQIRAVSLYYASVR